jgi:hypothetical protein
VRPSSTDSRSSRTKVTQSGHLGGPVKRHYERGTEKEDTELEVSAGGSAASMPNPHVFFEIKIGMLRAGTIEMEL